MQRNEILIEEDLFRFDISESGVEVLLIDEPRAAVIGKDLFGDELLVVLVGVGEMFEVLPAKAKRGALAVLPYQVLHPHSQIIVIDEMTTQNHLVQSLHEDNQPGKDELPFSGNGCTTDK